MRENDNHPLTNDTYRWGADDSASFLSENQKTVLRLFKRTGVVSLKDVRKASPYWNQAVKFLRRRGFIDWTNDDHNGYVLTRLGAGLMPGID
jgi:hypothetical protein